MLNFMKLILSFLCALCALVTLPAKADERLEIRSFFENQLKQIKEQAEPNGINISYEGPLLVEPAQGYYSITTPAVTVDMGLIVKLGNLSFNIVPNQQTEQWIGRVAYATPIVITSPDGNDSRELHLGAQDNIVTIDKKFDIFTSNKISIKDIILRDTQGRTHAQIEEVRMSKTMSDIDTGALEKDRNLGDFFYAGTGDINLSLSNTTFYIDQLLKSKSLSAKATQQDTLIAKAATLNIDLAHATQNGEIDYLALFSVKDLTATKNGKAIDFPVPAELRFQTMLKGLSRDLYRELIEENKALLKEHKDKITNPDSISETEKEAINEAFNATFDRFIEAAQKAGANFAYQFFLADRQDRTLKVETDVIGDNEHKLGMYGTTVLTVKGLESWLDSVKLPTDTKLQGVPEGMPIPNTVPAPVKAALIQLSETRQLNDGSTAHVFNFRVTKEGEMSVNDKNIQIAIGMLLGALMQSAPSQNAPSAGDTPSQDTPL
tara:strand:+ start:1154 stop:2626 length:1473 start_codon:yes stop_codon:yes gene_type:complete